MPEIEVALFARAWIEISAALQSKIVTSVALFARAWIEIPKILFQHLCQCVALFARAWIEICQSLCRISSAESPSLRGRGLK